MQFEQKQTEVILESIGEYTNFLKLDSRSVLGTIDYMMAPISSKMDPE